MQSPVAPSCAASTVLSCYSNTVFLAIIIRNFTREVTTVIALQTVCYVSALFKINFCYYWDLSFKSDIFPSFINYMLISSNLRLESFDILHCT